jgi:hypothetical protein
MIAITLVRRGAGGVCSAPKSEYRCGSLKFVMARA